MELMNKLLMKEIIKKEREEECDRGTVRVVMVYKRNEVWMYMWDKEESSGRGWLTCPCPRDIFWHRVPPYPLSPANFISPAMGSAPGDNTNIRGAQQWESAKLPARSKVGGSMN